MSFTATITQTASAAPSTPEVRGLTLKMPVEAIKKRVAALVVQMLSSPLFSSDGRDIIKGWEKNYYEKYLNSLSTEADRLNASHGLCSLLHKIIYPILSKCTAESINKKTVEAFEETLVDILKSTLPEGQDHDTFLDKFQVECHKKQLHQIKLSMIDACFREHIKHLESIEDATNEKLLMQYENLKKRMIEINADRKSMSEELNKRLDALTKKVEEIGKTLEDATTAVDEIGANLQSHQQRFLSILNACDKFLKEIA